MQHQVDALHGRAGMFALLRAFREAGREFSLGVMVAVPVNEPDGRHRLLFSIGETTAAMTVAEAQWFAGNLIENSGGLGQLSDDLEQFGRIMISIIAEAPGPHGMH